MALPSSWCPLRPSTVSLSPASWDPREGPHRCGDCDHSTPCCSSGRTRARTWEAGGLGEVWPRGPEAGAVWVAAPGGPLGSVSSPPRCPVRARQSGGASPVPCQREHSPLPPCVQRTGFRKVIVCWALDGTRSSPGHLCEEQVSPQRRQPGKASATRSWHPVFRGPHRRPHPNP